MIVEMVKYSFLIHRDGYDVFMADMKALGVLHIIEQEREANAVMTDAWRRLKEINPVIRHWSKLKPEASSPKNIMADGEELMAACQHIRQLQEQALLHVGQLQKEMRQIEPWGRFDRDNITRLNQAGLKVCFYSIAIRKFNDDWAHHHPLEVINDVGGVRYFVVFASHYACLELPEADEIHMPEKSLAELQAELKASQQKLSDLQRQEAQLANGGIDVLKKYSASLQDLISS